MPVLRRAGKPNRSTGIDNYAVGAVLLLFGQFGYKLLNRI